MSKSTPLNSVTEEDVLHEIRVKLYPSTLPKVEGKYIARTYNRKRLTIEDICKTLKRRTKYEGDYNEAVKAVKAFFDEMAYQLCDGHSVNTGYFSIHPNICGTFDSKRDIYDREKNPVSFRFRILAKLKRLARLINVEIEGLADTDGLIDTFYDAYTQTTNNIISGNDLFSISGEKIKVVDDGVNTECGIFFIKTDEPVGRVKVIRNLVENTATKIAGLTPMLVAPGKYRIEIVTQFNGSNTGFLKTPKTLTSDFELTIK